MSAAGVARRGLRVAVGIVLVWLAATPVTGAAAAGAEAPGNPKAKVLGLGVLPIFDKDDGIRKRIKTINGIVEKSADGQAVRFLDMGPKFVNEDGSRVEALYGKDRLHLSPQGYEVWDAQMTPVVRGMLK